MASSIVRNQTVNTELAKPVNLRAADVEELDRNTDDLGKQTPLLPLRPFTVEGELRYCKFEEYGGTGAQRSKGVKFIIDVTSSSEPAWKDGQGTLIPPSIKPGEWPCIYFTEHSSLHAVALDGHAVYRRRLFAAIAGQSEKDVQPSAVLKKLQAEVEELAIPIRMTRTFVRFTSNRKPVFDDQFEAL